MLISKKNKALIFRLKDPARITTVIPRAKKFIHNGKEYLAVKHGVEEVKVLENLGFIAPSPIKYYYDWPGRYKPFYAQLQTADFLSRHNRAFCLNSMGSGKTQSALWTFDYLKSQKVVNKALIVAPLSTMERTWADSIFEHFPHLTSVVIYGSREKRLQLLNVDADIYVINPDGLMVKGVIDALKERPDIDLVIIDEIAQCARNAGTDKWKALNTLVNKQVPRRAWGLTGTPTPNLPTDAWAQCKLLTPENVPPYFNRFRDNTMRQISQYVWVPRENATEVVHAAMQPAIRFSREECVDLPPCTFTVRQVELTAPQKKAYKEMLVRLKAEVDRGEVLAVNEAVKAQKLIQIACGNVYGSDGEELTIDAKPRMEVVREVCEEAATKTIVFVPFVSTIPILVEFLRESGFTVECIHGGVGKTERDRILGDFQRGSTLQVLVAQPGTMSHGVTLTAANTIVWYAPITSADTFDQANHRIIRPGQKHNQLVVMIEGTELERRYYKRLKDKQAVQGLLLDMVTESRVNT